MNCQRRRFTGARRIASITDLRKITIVARTTRPGPETESARRWRWRRLEALVFSPNRTFRSQPELARRLEQHAELLTEARALASAPQTRARGWWWRSLIAAARSSSAWAAGVFSGFGVSSSFRADLDFPPSWFCAVSFSCDFFFADFGLGVGVCRRFDFGEAGGLGRLARRRPLALPLLRRQIFRLCFARRGDSRASCDSLSSLVDSTFCRLVVC